jgi:DNA-binding response OmpR family regulator
MATDEKSQKSKVTTLLLIEDDVLLTDMYTRKLEHEGFKVIKALNGEAGLRAVYEEDIDLILLDLLLPRIQGIEVLETLKQNEKSKDIPVIALTNLAKEDLKQKAMELGAKEFLIKAQQDPDEVVEAIRRVLNK